ncbi:hypothetical protein PV458_00300 [Streptomyces sp. MN03-5084-2B]|nr:hypothetical protein [Streptomyces sp. MN03-5084-2B]
MAAEFAEALTVPNTTATFDAAHTQVVLSPRHPSELLGAVSAAAAAATDTLLFYCAARTSPYQPVPGEVLSGPNQAEDVVASLGEIAGIIGGAEAARSVRRARRGRPRAVPRTCHGLVRARGVQLRAAER